jgi:hypothetical protein
VGLVLCSDGVCDVAEADDCAAVVAAAWERGDDAAAVLANWAMQVVVVGGWARILGTRPFSPNNNNVAAHYE